MKLMFAPWQNAAAANAFPNISALTDALQKHAPQDGSKEANINIEPRVAKYFATAAIEIWQRAVQSLLISIAVTDESKLWSSVSGYYASHYTFRGLAHLLGYYQLFRKGWIIHLYVDGGRFVATYKKKRVREHDWYRGVVASDRQFRAEPFFTNPPPPALLDVAHRDRANYSDHLSLNPHIRSVNKAAIRARLQRISHIEVQAPEAFTLDKFPDVEAVQINAYQRIVRFRQYLDQTLDTNRLWNVHRTPGWAKEFTDFQLIEARGATQR